MTTPNKEAAEREALLAELDWCIENGNTGPRSHNALIAARTALTAPEAAAQDHIADGGNMVDHHPVCDRRYPTLCERCIADAAQEAQEPAIKGSLTTGDPNAA